MNNPDKHKPLSAEELFKLLDSTSNKASDFDELDDFEKEALEGFSSHSNSQKAKALTDELNLAIAKKSTESNNGGTKNKIIWFSAAASIVLVIIMSVFFFNETKEDSATNIALNELEEDKAPESLMEESKTIEATEAAREIPDTKTATQLNEPAQKIALKDQTVLYNKNAEGESLSGAASPIETIVAAAEYRAENKPTVSSPEKLAKDESKNRNDDNDLKKQEGIVSDNLETKKKEKISLEQEQVNDELQAKQNVAKTASNETAKSTKEEDNYYKADADKSVATKKTLEKEKAAAVSSGVKTKQTADSYDKSNSQPVGGNVASAPVSIADSKTMSAYYTGSELAIRDYVLEFLAKKSGSVIITGKYKITGNVSAKGELNVVTIIQISNENCHCTEQIKEALNSMTKWNPAVEGGKKSSSNVEFIVGF